MVGPEDRMASWTPCLTKTWHEIVLSKRSVLVMRWYEDHKCLPPMIQSVNQSVSTSEGKKKEKKRIGFVHVAW